MSIAVVLGTRPEIIKLAPVVHELQRLGLEVDLLHTGQHFDAAMSDTFMEAFGMTPAAVFDAGSRPRAAQIAVALSHLDDVFAAKKPSVVIVQGDTNSTLSGALAANARGIPLIHVEAGLRSRDRNMPEEHIRVMVDHIADVLCAPTELTVENLKQEGLPSDRILLTGNTVVEAVAAQMPSPSDRAQILARHGLEADRYILATIHRPENTDDPNALRVILDQLASLAKDGWPVVFPIHPRTAGAARSADAEHLLHHLRLLPPVGYAEFLSLAQHAAVLVSDSGGIQEETTILKRPLLVVRRSTERPEAMPTFAKLVAPSEEIGITVRGWLSNVAELHGRLAAVPSPYGDGKAAERIAKAAHKLAACN